MLLGKIFGKVTTKEFKFLVQEQTRKFEYVQIYHPVYDYVLCQILEIEKQDEMTTAYCQVIGFKDKDGTIKKLKIPFEPGSEVLLAEEDFIADVIKLENAKNGAYIGKLEGKNIPVLLDLKKLLTKHVAILAKSGSGKSYTVGVLLEEIIEKGVPLIVIDPHGEYPSMKRPNDDDNKELLARFGVTPKGFKITEYGDPAINPSCRPLRLADNLTRQELINLLPVKLSAAQLGVLHNAIQQSGDSTNMESILYQLQAEESNAKWNVISVIEQLKNLDLFSAVPTPFHELVKTGNCSVLNFRGVNPDVQEIIVYKLCRDLFELRKQNKIPPFFMVVEEAHNYCVTADTYISTVKGSKKITKLYDEQVITLNHKTTFLEENSIEKKWPERTAKVIRLTSVTGRTLKCTPDHTLFDGRHYTEAKDATHFLIPETTPSIKDEKLIKARLMGAIYSDGWVSVNKQVGFSGLKPNLHNIKKELHEIGIKSSQVHEFTNKKPSIITRINGEKNTFSGSGASIHCSTKGFTLFTKLGCLIGEKVTQETTIPQWISNGSKQVKAEFLAGLMGGDGDIPKARNCNFYSIKLYFTKVEKKKNYGIDYANALMKLFADLDIKTSLTVRQGNIRKKDKQRTTKYIISIHNEDENLIRFFAKINYRFNAQKEILAKQALTYLRIKSQEIKNREKLRKKALQLQKNKGWGKIRIAKELNLNPSLIAKWIYKSYGTKLLRIGKKEFQTFEEWKKIHCRNGFIYEKIIEKKTLGHKKVYNIQTKNKNYVANGILIHNCPERSFGEKKTSRILRTIASEGRKFGLGLCVVSQRPARVDKSVLSQCSTQILMKLTNPQDLKAMSSSVEGLTSATEREIQELPIGTSVITGVTDVPLIVNVRPRMSLHGGTAVDILGGEQDSDLVEQVQDFESAEVLPLFFAGMDAKDIMLMSDRPVQEVQRSLVPILRVQCKEADFAFSVLVDLTTGAIITDKDEYVLDQSKGSKLLPALDRLSKQELQVLHIAYQLQEFTVDDIINKVGLAAQTPLDRLTNIGLITMTQGSYHLSERYIFSKLANYKQFDEPRYEQIAYETKQDAAMNIDAVITQLQKFTEVSDHDQGYFVTYHLIYKNA